MTNLRSGINRIVAALLLGFACAAPASAQTAELDNLFAQLAHAGPEETSRIQGQIAAQWERSGSPAMDLLLRRGEDAMEAGDMTLAIQHLSALIDHAPKFAAGYNSRATVFYLTRQFGPSLADIQKTLALNPRHFGAMGGLAIILEELDRPVEAIEAYRQIQQIAPQAEGIADAIDRLSVKLNGIAL